MRKRNLQQSANITISSFTKKGHGLGTTDDEFQRTVEVPFTIPGDKVRALIHRKRSGVFSSNLEEIITPSPMRIEPRCVHFGTCGGCRWQQMPYHEQLRIKQDYVEKLFHHHLLPGVGVSPIIACDPPWQYRNKMEFSFSSDVAGKHYLGLIIDGSRGKVLNLSECHLVNPWFVETIHAAKSWWAESGLKAYHPHSNTGSLRTLTVREGMRTGDRLVMLTVSGNADYALSRGAIDSFTAYIRDAVEPVSPESKLSIFLRIHQAVKGVETNFYEMLLYGPDHIREILHIQADPNQKPTPITFSISPSAFFQPNTKQAERLYSTALQLLDIPEQSVVYDLYCGTGTLGICAAQKAKQVLGIEISPESSLDARTNAKNNKLDHVKIVTGAVKDAISSVLKEKDFALPDVVMVDPPRIGLDKDTLQHLSDLAPPKLLYISCNPVTQAENVGALREMGYRIEAIQPVDQFPHTVHTENIVIMTRN